MADPLPQLMDTPSVKRLATNPLLLTILVLISDKVRKLPQKRAKLYAICTKTLIESWRQEQTEQQSRLLDDLGEGGEEIVTLVRSPTWRFGCTRSIPAALRRSRNAVIVCWTT